MKPRIPLDNMKPVFVTPFVGVWIETLKNLQLQNERHVTPFVGVWIETANTIPMLFAW